MTVPFLKRFAAVGLLLLPAAVFAEPVRISALVTARGKALAPRALASWYVLEGALRKDPRFELVSLDPGDGEDVTRSERLAQARKRLDEAQAEYVDLDFDQALTKVDEALVPFQDGWLQQGREVYLEALGLRALILQGKGQTQEAEQWMEKLYVMNPHYQFKEDPSHQFYEVAARARRKVTDGPRVRWRIRTGEVTGLVFVDGVWRGGTPQALETEYPGEHFLTVRAPGFRSKSMRVILEGSQETDVVLEPRAEWKEFRARMEAVEESLRRDEVVSEGVSLARTLGVERVLLGRLTQGEQGLEVTGWVVDAGGKVATDSKSLSLEASADEVATFLASLLDKPLQVPAPKSFWGDPGTRRTLVYTAAGVSVAAGVVGALLGRSAVDQAAQAGQVPMVDEQRYQQLVGGAQATSVGANTLYVVSIAAAGAAAWLFLMPGEPVFAPATQRKDSSDPWSLQVSPLPNGWGASVRRSF